MARRAARFPGAARHGRPDRLRHVRFLRLPPKAVLFTRQALDICARGALEHLHAERGELVLPPARLARGGAMIYLRAGLAGTAVHALEGKWNPRAYADLMKTSGGAVVLTRAHAGR